MPAIRLHITGRVQGVWFRATVKERADELGIKGWVRNTDDGAVEILAEGEEDSLDQFRQWCRKGPPMAQVEELSEENFFWRHNASGMLRTALKIFLFL
jgi:acylphosphatase